MIVRPDWSLPRRTITNKLDLSTNICFDWVVQSEITSFLRGDVEMLDVSDYTDELPLYQSISSYHDVEIGNIAVGFGLGELFGRILLAYRSKISGLAIVSPTWQMVDTFCQMHNIRHVSIPTPLSQPINCNAIYVANPSGVLGNAYSKDIIKLLLELYDIVFVDESYADYSTIECSVLKQAVHDERLIVLKTLSKSIGVAGLRVGYSIGTSNNTSLIQQYRPASVANKLSVDLAPLLFDIKRNHITRMVECREWLIRRYDLPASNGNYVLFHNNVPPEIDETCLLKQCGVYQRMTVTNKETLEHVLSR